MKSRLMIGVCAAAVICGSSVGVLAKEKHAGANRDRSQNAPAADTAKQDRPHKGLVSEKAADAATNVVAVLTWKSKAGEEKKYNLLAAEHAMINLIMTFVGREAVVKGPVTADGTGIDVTDIVEPGKGGGKAHGPKLAPVTP